MSVFVTTYSGHNTFWPEKKLAKLVDGPICLHARQGRQMRKPYHDTSNSLTPSIPLEHSTSQEL